MLWTKNNELNEIYTQPKTDKTKTETYLDLITLTTLKKVCYMY